MMKNADQSSYQNNILSKEIMEILETRNILVNQVLEYLEPKVHENVRIIPALLKENKKLKVAAYCRVSTFGSAQLRSLEFQITTYAKTIRSHPDWIYAGVFYERLLESYLGCICRVCHSDK